MPQSSSSADVSLVGLTKTHGEVLAVNNVSLDVQPGEFVTLLGPSGCGKTSTLRLIAGFDQPDGGEVFVRGVRMGNTPPHARPTSMVFQSYALFPHMTVRENIMFGLRERGVSGSTARDRSDAMLELIGLPEVADRMPGQLSGGQQQRVALARSLVIEPAVLLLDEPFGALDLHLRKQMQAELKRIHGQAGITFIHVTHDQEEALSLSDRIVVMNNGAIEQVGSPEDVYERPATAFVAAFMGGSNVLNVTVVDRSSGGTTVALAGVTMSIPDALPDARECHLVVRPERVSLSANGRIAATVIDRAYVGRGMTYTLELRDGQRLKAEVPIASGEQALAIGAAVTVVFRAEDARLVPKRAS